MNSELRTRLMDYLDGLLEPEAEAAVVELLAGDEEAVAELERVKHLRAAIYKPGKVPEPHGALKERVFREIGEAPRRLHVMRHVASFAAGVLTTFGLLSLPWGPPDPAEVSLPSSTERAPRTASAHPVEMVEMVLPEFDHGESDFDAVATVEYQDRLPGYYDEPDAPAEFARRIR